MNGNTKLTTMMNSKLFSGFSTEECMVLEKTLQPVVKFYSKGITIRYENDISSEIGIIINGRVNGKKFYIDGNSHLIHSFGVRDIIGLEAICSSKGDYPVTLTAFEDTSLLVFPYKKMISGDFVLPSVQSHIKENIIRILADENIKSLYKLEVLSKRSLRSRIMTFLRIMEKKVGNKTFQIGMNREQFAQYLCVNRSALSYELNQMKNEGLITFIKDTFTMSS